MRNSVIYPSHFAGKYLQMPNLDFNYKYHNHVYKYNRYSFLRNYTCIGNKGIRSLTPNHFAGFTYNKSLFRLWKIMDNV
jgi:hypothetical protein